MNELLGATVIQIMDGDELVVGRCLYLEDAVAASESVREVIYRWDIQEERK